MKINWETLQIKENQYIYIYLIIIKIFIAFIVLFNIFLDYLSNISYKKIIIKYIRNSKMKENCHFF